MVAMNIFVMCDLQSKTAIDYATFKKLHVVKSHDWNIIINNFFLGADLRYISDFLRILQINIRPQDLSKYLQLTQPQFKKLRLLRRQHRELNRVWERIATTVDNKKLFDEVTRCARHNNK